MPRSKRLRGPRLAVWFGTAFVAEAVVSNNTPTLLFLNPLVIVLLSLLYGPPALLLRDAWVRGRIGWPGALVGGAAFGALNEGVVANTWFDPHALHFGARALGRVAGVNWNIVANLTVFHMFVSLVVPIALAQLTFPESAGEPWLNKRGTILCFAVSAFVGVGSILPKHDHGGHAAADAGKRALVLVLIVLAVLVAGALPKWRLQLRGRVVPSPRRVALAGSGFSIAFFLLFFGLPNLAPAAVIPVSIAFASATTTLLLRWTASTSWTARHTLFLIAGVAAPSMLGSLVRVLALQPLSTLLFVWYLRSIDRRLSQVQ